MTIGQTKLIENYSSLRNKTNSKNLELMLEFCNLFQTDDVELFEYYEYLSNNESKTISVDGLINLYAKRYSLNAQTDIEKIMYIFLNNRINNGIAYHLNSSANLESIMEIGLGISAIGLKTDERKDYEQLQKIIPQETWRKLQPFNGEKKEVAFYYSKIPILHASYGKRPEWLRELKKNSWEVENDPFMQKVVNDILEKYDKKYDNAKKMLFVIPSPIKKLSESDVDTMLQTMTPKEIISKYYFSLLSGKDERAKQHISSSEIIAIDLETLNLYYNHSNGIIENIDNTQGERHHFKR